MFLFDKVCDAHRRLDADQSLIDWREDLLGERPHALFGAVFVAEGNLKFFGYLLSLDRAIRLQNIVAVAHKPTRAPAIEVPLLFAALLSAHTHSPFTVSSHDG